MKNNITTIVVKITKDILKKSMMCGTNEATLSGENISQNCAVALAIREIFPEARVTNEVFAPFNNSSLCVEHNGNTFIKKFDAYRTWPKLRLDLPETEVELYLTNKVIDRINIDLPNWEDIVSESEVLELV